MLLMQTLAATAQVSYRTAELKRLAAVVQLDEASLPADGYTYLTYKGRRITVCLAHHVVSHIGFSLFSEEMRLIDKSPVFDFLERYFLLLNYPPVDMTKLRMVSDDQFRFLKGSLATVANLRPSDSFSYALDNKVYTARWNRDGKDLLEVSFPAEYELISGENKREAEDYIMADIQRTRPVVDSVSEEAAQGSCYISEEMTSRLYFHNGKLLVNGLHQEQSAANMMLTTATEGNYTLLLTQVSYGFKKTSFEVPLKQWITFCRNNGCQLYFGVDHVDKDGTVSGLVLAVNERENYNHVLTVEVPMSVISRKEGIIDARLYPYIPTHNVKALFAKFKPTNDKDINN